MAGGDERFFEALCRHASFALIAADRSQNIRSWNLLAEQLFGRHADQMVGTSLLAAFPEEIRAQIAVLVTDAIERGASNDVEYTTTKPNGDATILVAIVSPVLGEGETLGVSLAFRDISIRRQAVQAVRDTAARLRAIFETAAEGIIT